MIEYVNYDKALIVTGDGDFYCLADYLAKKDKLLKLIIPNMYKYSSLYRKIMPYLVFMNNWRGKLEHTDGLTKQKERHYRGTEPFG